MKTILIVGGMLTCVACAGPHENQLMDADSRDAYLVVADSAQPFDVTVERIQNAIERRGLSLFGTIDHQENAQRAGLSLRPSTVLSFGNPRVGTPLMVAKPTVAIDLPQRMLVWEEDGRVYVAYNHPTSLLVRHGLADEKARLEKVAGLLAAIAREATAP